jgi:peroxiredoxin
MKILGSVLLAAALSMAAIAQTPAAVTPLKVGDKAPEFSLHDQNNKVVKLSDFKGKTVVLAFYVLAFTGG